MRKTLIYKKRVQDETGREYILWYSLVIRVAEHGRIYGAEKAILKDVAGQKNIQEETRL